MDAYGMVKSVEDCNGQLTEFDCLDCGGRFHFVDDLPEALREQIRFLREQKARLDESEHEGAIASLDKMLDTITDAHSPIDRSEAKRIADFALGIDSGDSTALRNELREAESASFLAAEYGNAEALKVTEKRVAELKGALGIE